MRLLAMTSLVLVCLALLPRLARAQPQRPLKVAFIGDSLTMGLNASEERTRYRDLFVRRLRLAEGDEALSVVIDPYGMTDDALRRLPPLLEFQPDLVIVELGNHEVFAGDGQIDQFPYQYDELLYQLQLTGATIIAGTVAWLNYPYDSREYRDAMRINAIIRNLSAHRGIAVADVWSATVTRPELISSAEDVSFLEPYSGDDLHPNDAGHRAIANAYWDAYQRERARQALAALAP
jgi:lysophospholipase L1-like esterase